MKHAIEDLDLVRYVLIIKRSTVMINEIIVLLKMVLQKNLDLIKNSQDKSQDEKILLIFLVINALNEMIEKIMSGFPGGES